jgi:hypothetical protein
MNMEVGTIFEFADQPGQYKLLAFDQVEFLFEPKNKATGNWFFSDFSKEGNYIRMPTPYVLKHGMQVGKATITDEEWHIHRPDLPLRLCRLKQIDWDTISIDGLLNTECDCPALQAKSIYLLPTTKNKRMPKGYILASTINNIIDPKALLTECLRLQEGVYRWVGNEGFGIFRRGFHKSAPSYYIWKYIDLAGAVTYKLPE